MRFTIDDAAGTLEVDEAAKREVPLYSPEAFEILSAVWLKVGWDQKYPYCFSWMGRPVIQLPEDLVRLQEVVWAVQPDVVVETGVAHGGSSVFLAGLFRTLGKGRVISVDIEIRPHNRKAIEEHPLADLITLVEGDAVAPETVAIVRNLVKADESVLVLLDSNHSFEHVSAELEAYWAMVSVGSYIIAADGITASVADTPRGNPGWKQNNPAEAAKTFAARHPEFILEEPPWPFNESPLTRSVTHWPSAWLRRSEV
jgi:cephalosporin hydroxylase